MRRDLNYDIIQKYKNLPWNWYVIVYLQLISWDNIKDNLDIRFDWDIISNRSDIGWDIIKNNLEYPWNWDVISKRPFITMEILNEYHYLKWDWKYLSYHTELQSIDKYIHLPWSWMYINFRKDVSFDFIEKHIYKAWDLNELKLNRTLAKELNICKPNGINIYSFQFTFDFDRPLFTQIPSFNHNKPADMDYDSIELYKQLINILGKMKAKYIMKIAKEHIMKICWNPEKPLGKYLVELEYND